jgi:hypothetical protein
MIPNSTHLFSHWQKAEVVGGPGGERNVVSQEGWTEYKKIQY